MQRFIMLTALVALLTLMLPGGVALGQSPVPGPSVRYQTKFEVPNPPTQFEIVQLILDFAPGAWTPAHTHGGQVFVTVIEGEMRVRGRGAEQIFPPARPLSKPLVRYWRSAMLAQPRRAC